MHGITHLTGGADPIPGLLPQAASDYPAAVVGLGPYAYWRLGETAGPWLDTSGVGSIPADLTLQSGTAPLTANVAGVLPDDGAVQFNYGGTTSGGGDYIRYGGGSPGEKTFNQAEFTAVVWAKITAPNLDSRGVIMGNTIVGSFGGVLNGWALEVMPTLQVRFTVGMTDGSTERYAETPVGVATGAWVFLTGTYTAADSMLHLYINGELIAETHNPAAGPTGGGIRFGWGGGDATHPQAFYNGVADEGAYWDRALTLTEIRELYAAGAAAAGGREGDVLTVDGDGNPVWAPPGIEVEHGGGTPDENPVTTSGAAYAGFPANPSGWHYAAHTETAVLYDSTPARFDVPSMKWVRAPFNTVRIQRRWELTVGGQFRDAWLPDDRGLTEHARNGLLHITPDMVSDTVKHVINGFFSIEYPVLDDQGLPDYTGGGVTAPDDYVRAGRVLNASTGVVLRRLPGSTQRRFMQWEFFNDADGMAVSVLYSVDNPYPIYPVWPARPLTLPQPYPQLSPTDSLNYYLTNFGNPGFNDGTFALEQNLVAGDNLSLQAWQDSPWLLRFSTDHFPNWRPWPDVEVWRRRPFLSVTYTYDPDSVDHSTGRLL